MPTRVKLCYWLVVGLIVVAQAQLHKQIAAMCMLQQLELDVCIVLSCAPMVYQAKQCATHAHCATPDNWTEACKLSSQGMLVHRMRQAANIQFALGWQLLVGSGRAQAAPRSCGRLAAHADCQRSTIHHLTVHALQNRAWGAGYVVKDERSVESCTTCSGPLADAQAHFSAQLAGDESSWATWQQFAATTVCQPNHHTPVWLWLPTARQPCEQNQSRGSCLQGKRKFAESH